MAVKKSKKTAKTKASGKAVKKAAVKAVKKPAGKTVKKALKKAASVKAPAKRATKSAAPGGRAAAASKKQVLPETEKLRKKLIEHRRSIISEAKGEIAKFIRGDERQLVDTALDDGDWSLVDVTEDINLSKLTSHKETLNKIDEALRKMNEGTYGICEDCGAEISEARLSVIPFAIHCVDCKEKRERMEEFEREEEF